MLSCTHPDDRVFRFNGGWMCDGCDSWHETDPRKLRLEDRIAALEDRLDMLEETHNE